MGFNFILPLRVVQGVLALAVLISAGVFVSGDKNGSGEGAFMVFNVSVLPTTNRTIYWRKPVADLYVSRTRISRRRTALGSKHPQWMGCTSCWSRDLGSLVWFASHKYYRRSLLIFYFIQACRFRRFSSYHSRLPLLIHRRPALHGNISCKSCNGSGSVRVVSILRKLGVDYLRYRSVSPRCCRGGYGRTEHGTAAVSSGCFSHAAAGSTATDWRSTGLSTVMMRCVKDLRKSDDSVWFSLDRLAMEDHRSLTLYDWLMRECIKFESTVPRLLELMISHFTVALGRFRLLSCLAWDTRVIARGWIKVLPTCRRCKSPAWIFSYYLHIILSLKIQIEQEKTPYAYSKNNTNIKSEK